MDRSDDRIESSRRALTVIGAPLEDGAGVAGTVMGPAALRTAGLIRILRDLGNEVDDRGDLRLEERVPEPVLMAGSARRVAARFPYPQGIRPINPGIRWNSFQWTDPLVRIVDGKTRNSPLIGA